MTVNIYDAKAQLSRLVDQAAAGEDVMIDRAGKPVARLTRLTAPKRRVRFGVLKRKIKIADDFDAALPDALQASFPQLTADAALSRYGEFIKVV